VFVSRIQPGVVAIALLVVVLGTRPAGAQVVLDGDRWRIVIGGPVGISDKADTGWGHVPGSNGFVPGYGYYPDYSANWPTLREAIQNDPRRQKVQPGGNAVPVETGPAACAVIEVLVRADAELSFCGHKTGQQGTVRCFVTPPLVIGKTYYYDMQARWHENGREFEQVRSVPIQGNTRQTVDLRSPELLPTPVSK
jgi:uncharacterized protein (TIGR03000 family)